MNWGDPQAIVSLIAAIGIGGIFTGVIQYFKDRKKVASDTHKTDVDTKLAYLNTVIERLDAEVKRVLVDRDRIKAEWEADRLQFQQELDLEQSRSAKLRMRVRELEDEIDGVRKAARETQKKCDELASRLQELIQDAQD